MKINSCWFFPLFEKTEVLSTQHRNCLVHWDQAIFVELKENMIKHNLLLLLLAVL